MAKKSGPDKRQIACLRDLARWFDEEGVPGVIVGGMAVLFLGRERNTKDVDALVFLDEDNLDDALATGAEYGFEPRIRDVMEIARKSRVLVLTHSSTGVAVDLILGAIPFEREIIKRSSKRTARGVSIPLPSPGDLVVMKILASRPRDLVDVEGILDKNPRLSIARVRRLVREFGEGLEMPEIIDTLEDILRRRKSK